MSTRESGIFELDDRTLERILVAGGRSCNSAVEPPPARTRLLGCHLSFAHIVSLFLFNYYVDAAAL